MGLGSGLWVEARLAIQVIHGSSQCTWVPLGD